MATIRTGEIAVDLLRPMDFFAAWLARDLGRAAFHLLGRGVPLLLVYPLFFRLVWPSSAWQWLAFGFSVGLAVVASFAWRFLVNCAAFWTVDARGVGRMAFLGMLLVSGLVVPLAFFPDPWQWLVRGLPFAAFINAPAEVFMGSVRGPALAATLGLQLFWVAALTVAARWVFGRGVRHLVVQGG
jgi:ABC-2 type transport system permease protein